MYNLSEHHLGTNELIKCVTYASFSIRPAHWTLRPQDFETCCPYASDWLLAYGCPYASHCLRLTCIPLSTGCECDFYSAQSFNQRLRVTYAPRTLNSNKNFTS